MTDDGGCVPCRIANLYDQYDLNVSGDINGVHAWDLIINIEETMPVDDIRLKDGTRIWNLLRIFLYTFHHELSGKRRFKLLSLSRLIPYKPRIEREDVVDAVVDYVCCRTKSDKDVVSRMMYDYIKVFALLKGFYHLRFLNRKIVYLSGCGYGRRAMAQAQACRELGIMCVEHQHGVIDRYFPAYMSHRQTMNHECLPSHLIVFDDKFKEIVDDGHLFDDVIVEKQEQKKVVLFSGQWVLASSTEVFIKKVAGLLPADYELWFMPHPLDNANYDGLMRENIVLVDRGSDFFTVLNFADIHATVFSGRGYYTFTHGVKTIFVDLLGLCKGFPVSAEDFVEELKKI